MNRSSPDEAARRIRVLVQLRQAGKIDAAECRRRVNAIIDEVIEALDVDPPEPPVEEPAVD